MKMETIARALLTVLILGIITALLYIFADDLKLNNLSMDFSKTISVKKLPKRPGYHTDPIIEFKNRRIVHLGDYTTNIVREGKATKFFKSKITVHTTGEEASEEIKRENILIRDAVIDALSSKRYEEIATQEGKLQLKDEVRDAINGRLRTGQVEEVFFTQFIIQ
jgi:flagellar basal body-associated protein FliL